MRKHSEYMRSIGNKQITVFSTVLFIMIIAGVIFSGEYMSICIEREAAAQKNRSELRKLGEQLATASDYLTEEARQYSLTGSTEHLYNYWNEVMVVKSRDLAVSQLSRYNSPEKEKNLLWDAKVYSDNLIETEILSMKLMLSGKEITALDYKNDGMLYQFIKRVEDYELPEEYADLSNSEKIAKSSEILYDYFYAQSKTLIMTPIDEFQEEMNSRLDNDVINAENGIRTASAIQNLCSISAIVFIAALLLLWEFLYIKPLRHYTNVLENENIDDISKVRVSPEGASELFRFGEVFNHLALMLENELIKTEKAEQQMREAKTQAEKANNAKSEFLAHMSHELRTPLNAITGYLYLLGNTKLSEVQAEYCRSIEISSENLLGLINNVLDFSKIESGYMEFEKVDYDFYALIEEVISIMKVQAINKGLQLKYEINDIIPHYVNGDPLRTKQVLINLIGNAVKFTDNGEINLTIKALEIKEDKIIAEFCVKDTGIGISLEDSKKIFEPFVQSDAGVTRRYGGTGLGLPISNMIVKNASNGDFSITAKHNDGQGSSFIFNAYLCYGNMPQNLKENNITPIIRDNVTVLLVDDNRINLEIEKRILLSYNISVITASNGYDALNIAEKNGISMIFLDLHMPEIDGFDTARKMRKIKKLAYTPIIALTADVVTGVEEKVHAAEMNDYLSKPFKPVKLRNLIAKYLDIIKEDPESLTTESNRLFDIKMCLDNIDNDNDMLRELIEHFIREYRYNGEYIKSHIKNRYYVNVRHILHDVKGISGNLCCNRLCLCSDKLLGELHENRFDSLDEFLEVWYKTIEKLKQYLIENPAHDTENKSANFTSSFNVFLELCKNYDISAVDCFHEHRKLFKNNMKKDEFQQLNEMINKYDFKAVCAIFNLKGE